MATSDLHTALLALHKTLLDTVRRDYEKIHGRLTPNEFLGALIQNADFAWLRPLTTSLVSIGEDESNTVHQSELKALLTAPASTVSSVSDFQRHYATLLHENPDLTYAHAKLMRALK